MATKFMAFIMATIIIATKGLQATSVYNPCQQVPKGPFRKYKTDYVKKFVEQGNLGASMTQSKLIDD